MSSIQTRGGSYPPFLHDWKTTAKVSWIVILTLCPIVAWSGALYGPSALGVWLVSVASALASEAIVCAVRRRWTLGDGSALLTGLLVAAVMPPSISWYIPAISSAFAILVVKAAFGGLGANWMNPALAGAAFAYANWPARMREFVAPRLLSGVDGVSAATPVEFVRGLAGVDGSRLMDSIHAAGFPLSGIDSKVTGFLNDALFSKLGARLPEGYIDLFIGYRPGALGESALILVLLGAAVLIGLKIIRAEVPVALLVVFTVLSRAFGTGLPGEAFMGGDAIFALAGGGIALASFYMATDPVSSPIGTAISIAYGAGAGALCFALRKWGTFSESVTYALLVMNVAAPAIERAFPAGARRKAEAKKA